MNFYQLQKIIYPDRRISSNMKINCENIGLILTKFVNLNVIKNSKLKKNFLFAVTNKTLPKELQNIFMSLVKKIQKELISLTALGFQTVINQPFTTNSRLIIGLGTDSVLETSLTLHKIFGIPYIPATALKGVVRAVKFWNLVKAKDIASNEKSLKVFQEKFYGELETSDEDTFKAQLLFGAKNFKGLLLFLDAFPEINNENLFDVDIMNVHYPDYYSKNEPPGDWQQPKPIFFLTVKEEIKFHIAVLFDQYRHERLPKEYKKLDLNNLQTELVDLVSTALSEFGIGAKTRVGYGVLA